MRKAIALLRARVLVEASYRVQLLLSLVSLLATVVPLYFIAGALQPVMADSIRAEGGQYFGFLVVGTVTFYFLNTAVNALPDGVGGDLRTGTLEAVLATPARLPEIITGMIGFGLFWAAARALVLLAVAWALGAPIVWSRLPAAALVLALIVLAHLPFGIIASALIIAFRTAGPLANGVIFLSTLLGGVYYPTRVIPSWLHSLSVGLPLTYGLRALRRILLEGAPLRGVLGDVGALTLFATLLFACGAFALSTALRFARRAGTLAQY